MKMNYVDLQNMTKVITLDQDVRQHETMFNLKAAVGSRKSAFPMNITGLHRFFCAPLPLSD